MPSNRENVIVSGSTGIRVRLTAAREACGISVAELARRAGVSRQTVYAIESGVFIPNTAVALRMARALEVPVEQLFSLAAKTGGADPRVRICRAVMIAGTPRPELPVRLARSAAGWVCAPCRMQGYFLAQMDGRIRRLLGGARVEVECLNPEAAEGVVVVAGCDPALGLLASAVQGAGAARVLLAPVSSRKSMDLLKKGRVHVAGVHLKDPATGEWNLPQLRRAFPGEDLTVVTFARWQEGLVVARGNPLRLRTVEDLARPGVRFINREPGTGSRALLDRMLRQAGLRGAEIRGYETVAGGHLPAAAAVARGEADCCIAVSAAARAYGLDFIPLEEERFDLAARRGDLELAPVRGLFEVLSTGWFRKRLAAAAGYDVGETGKTRME
ncbi:MAG: substrate-binding domain-containing protein [Bryobacteraceae bacterium]